MVFWQFHFLSLSNFFLVLCCVVLPCPCIYVYHSCWATAPLSSSKICLLLKLTTLLRSLRAFNPYIEFIYIHNRIATFHFATTISSFIFYMRINLIPLKQLFMNLSSLPAMDCWMDCRKEATMMERLDVK